MLLNLHIKNYALIDELHLSLNPGLNVFTGETGAGKSILIDALNQVLGNRADSNLIRSGEETSIVEALFDIQSQKNIPLLLDSLGYPMVDEQQLLLRRELSRSGKNRCWIGGQLSTLSILQQIGQELVDMHGQHEHQSLLRTSKQMEVLDEFANSKNLREKSVEIYYKIQSIYGELKHLKQSDTEKQKWVENYNFQITEIESANLKEGDEETLTQQRQLLRHSEKLSTLISIILNELNGSDSQSGNGILLSLSKVHSALSELKTIDPKISTLETQLDSVEITINQIYREMISYSENITRDPQQLEQIEEKLDMIHRLKRKYQADSLVALFNLKKKWKQELVGIEHQESRISELTVRLKQTLQEWTLTVHQLSKKRELAAKKLSKYIENELVELGMKNATCKINIQHREDPNGWIEIDGITYKANSNGMDMVEFLFSANLGEPPKPISKIISGGELSRIMLALKTIFSKGDLIPTLIFDEIDVGIGGAMASTVSRKLKQIAQQKQVLVITHLPVIAAAAQTHFSVIKLQDSKRTAAQIQTLSKEERVQEIARMTSGELVSNATLTHAKELLGQAGKPNGNSKRSLKKRNPKKISR